MSGTKSSKYISEFILLSTLVATFGCSTILPGNREPTLPERIEARPPVSEGVYAEEYDVFSKLPERVRLSPASIRLPGGTINTRGSLRAIMLPVSFGSRLPLWTDSLLAYHVVGSARSGEQAAPRGVSGILADESNGLFQMEATIFPYLTATHIAPENIAQQIRRPAVLEDLAKQALNRWSRQANLAAFNNDGPDGQPMSEDDDGKLDFVIMALETDTTPLLAHVDPKVEVRAGRDGRFKLDSGPVHVIALPRTGVFSNYNVGALSLVLSAMGLEDEEMFFPEPLGAEHILSSVGRIRLGWVPVQWGGRSGLYRMDADYALVAPIIDVKDYRGLWIIERVGDAAYLSRVVRNEGGHFSTLEIRKIFSGEGEMIIPLTQTAGELGPRLRVDWSEGPHLNAYLSLTPQAVSQDETRRY